MENINIHIEKLLTELEDIKSLINTTTNDELNSLLGSEDGDFSELSDTMKQKIASKGNKIVYNLLKQLQSNYVTILDIAIEINKKADSKNKDLLELQKLKEKKVLTVNDVEKVYSFSKTQQAGFRGRLSDSLPFMKESTNSRSSNTKILYNRDELEYWMDNFY